MHSSVDSKTTSDLQHNAYQLATAAGTYTQLPYSPTEKNKINKALLGGDKTTDAVLFFSSYRPSSRRLRMLITLSCPTKSDDEKCETELLFPDEDPQQRRRRSDNDEVVRTTPSYIYFLFVLPLLTPLLLY
jgi:hypothetical protein